MSERFDRATHDAFEGNLELLEANQMIPVVYKNTLYFIHSIEPRKLCLVRMDAKYTQHYQYLDGSIEFEPEFQVEVKPDDPALPYLLEMANKKENRVDVVFAEIFDIDQNKMTTLPEGSDVAYHLTNRYFQRDVEDHSFIPV